MPTKEERRKKNKVIVGGSKGLPISKFEIKTHKQGKVLKSTPVKPGGKSNGIASGATTKLPKPAKQVIKKSKMMRVMPTAVPTQKDIEDKTASLSGSAAAAFIKIVKGLSDHLGSQEGARLWLVTPSAQFDTTPLDAILAGEAESVLAYLESHWGPGPAYA